MEKRRAVALADQIDAYSASPESFSVQRFGTRRPLKNFHKWVDGKPLVSAYNLTRDDEIRLKLLLIKWNDSDEFYATLFPDDASNPYAEIWMFEDDGPESNLVWKYTPRKRDGKNEDRVAYFAHHFGDTTVRITLPHEPQGVSRFLTDLFDLVDHRRHADELSVELPEIRREFPEGAAVERLHKSRERSSGLVAQVKREALRLTGKLCCCVCGFDFYEFYGALGEGFIEAHHIRPLSELVAGAKTRMEDIALVCSNCHSVLHRRRPWLTPDELRAHLTP